MARNLKQNKAQSTCAESTHKGVNWRSEDVTQHNFQQRQELPTVTLTWHASKYKVHKPPEVHPLLIDREQLVTSFQAVEDVPLVEFYLLFTCMPGMSYHRLLQSLSLCFCDAF